jgi:hypothetical protein
MILTHISQHQKTYYSKLQTENRAITQLAASGISDQTNGIPANW